MLLGGVVPLAHASPFLVAVQVWTVLPRKNGPVAVLNLKRYVMSARPSPFRSM